MNGGNKMTEKKILGQLLEIVDTQGAAHLSLIDPDPHKARLASLPEYVSSLEKAGTDGFMVGGSTALDSVFITKVCKSIKKATEKPVILFPSGPGGISEAANAIFFMFALNSTNPYFMGKVQALGAPIIKRRDIEAISMAYLIFQPGGSASYICDADPLPRKKPEIAVAYSMAADLIGFDIIYLEAGSGAKEPIPVKTISRVKQVVSTPIIVGGGIKTPEQATKVVKAGGKIIVQGTRFEATDQLQKVEKRARTTINTIKNE